MKRDILFDVVFTLSVCIFLVLIVHSVVCDEYAKGIFWTIWLLFAKYEYFRR